MIPRQMRVLKTVCYSSPVMETFIERIRKARAGLRPFLSGYRQPDV